MAASGLGSVDSGIYGSIMMGSSSAHREQRPEPQSHLKTVVMPGDNFFAPVLLDDTWSETITLSTPPTGNPNGNLLIFNVEKRQDNWCIFPKEMGFSISYKIQDKDGNPPPKNEKICPIPGFPNALFKSMKFYMNNIEVGTGDAGAYPLRGHLNFLMGTSSSGKTKAAAYGEALMEGHDPNDIDSPPYEFVRSLMTKQEPATPELSEEEREAFDWDRCSKNRISGNHVLSNISRSRPLRVEPKVPKCRG